MAQALRSERSPQDLVDQVVRLQSHVRELEEFIEHQERLTTLGTISGLIAHEFNNILTPVMSYSQMALAAPEDSALVKKALSKAMEGSERASRIASAILGLVRDESMDLRTPSRSGSNSGDSGGSAGTGHTVPRGTSTDDAPADRCDVRRAINQALACMAREPAKDGIRFKADIADGITCSMREVALEHVLLNLLLNARNAMIPGGGELRVKARTCQSRPPAPADAAGNISPAAWNDHPGDGDGPWVEIQIEDTGRGMSPERLAAIFRPFVSGDWARPREKNSLSSESTDTYDSNPASRPGAEVRRGTGLGMTICKRLIEDAGGAIWVWSRQGHGTRVNVLIPAGG